MHLRVYNGHPAGPATDRFGIEALPTTTVEPKSEDDPVRVRLGDVLPILHEAVLSRRAWIRDFADDDIEVSRDLYEILATYLHLRPSA